ncbi:hypothetical protein EON62_05755 [archaeon]|nr:MAG: hypothetical protein EON62_05755 [archaeon]
MMALQTARYLMSSYAKVQADPRAVLAGSVRYLTDDVPSLCGAACVDDMFQPNLQLAAMRWRARTSVQRVAARLAEAKARGLTDDEAWNLHAVALVDASRSHVYLNIAAFFAVAVAKRGLEEQAAGVRPPSTSSGDAPDEVVDPLTGVRVHLSPGSAGDAKSPTVWLRAKHSRELSGQTEDSEAAATSKNGPAAVPVTCALYDVLKMMCDVFVLSHIQSDAAFYLYHGYMTPAQIDMLDAALQRCLSASRLDALALVDAFDISDYVLNAPLARADGRLYEAYFENAAYMNDAEWAAYVRTAKPVLCDTM